MDEMIKTQENAVEEVAPEEVAPEVVASVEVAENEDSLSGLTEKQRRRRDIFDKITTGLLIALMASPVLILAYIFIWFIINITSR